MTPSPKPCTDCGEMGLRTDSSWIIAQVRNSYGERGLHGDDDSRTVILESSKKVFQKECSVEGRGVIQGSGTMFWQIMRFVQQIIA